MNTMSLASISGTDPLDLLIYVVVILFVVLIGLKIIDKF